MNRINYLHYLDLYVNINYRQDNFHSKYCIFQPKAISINFLAIRFGKFKAKNKGNDEVGQKLSWRKLNFFLSALGRQRKGGANPQTVQ